jgi:hypothetical protein
MGQVCNTHVEMRNVYKILGGDLEDKRPPSNSRSKWEDNIKNMNHILGK